MTTQGKNYTLKEIGPFENLLERDYKGFGGKYFVGNDLGLTGCEVSLNRIPAGKAMPFVHAHKKNEELYIITGGNGTFYVDGDEFPVQEGSLIRVAPAGERAWKAGDKDLGKWDRGTGSLSLLSLLPYSGGLRNDVADDFGVSLYVGARNK